jgi:hypothetical protein
MAFPLYQGLPVLDWEPDAISPSSGLEFRSAKTRWDNTAGRVADDNPYEPGPRTRRTFRFVLDGRSEIADMVTFLLTQVQGRRLPFWVPNWMPDMLLATARVAADDDLYIAPIGYVRSFAGQGRGHAHLAITPRAAGGGIRYREITHATEELDGTERLRLDAALGEDLAVTDPVSFLLLCRADADLVPLVWHTPELATLELPLIDLPWEG